MDKDLDINLIIGDSSQEMKKIPSNSVDLIIADPPYNLNKSYGNNIDSYNFNDYLEFSKKWLSECKRVLSPEGTIYVFMGMRFVSYIYIILEQELNMNFNSWITWHYTQGIGKKKGFSPRHDDILMFTKSNKFKFNIDNIRVPQKYYRSVNNMEGANPGNVWEFSHIHYCNSNRKAHPTQKPEGLYERMLLASSDVGSLVLDPFVGSGTAARVCQQLKRKCIGIDINPDYIKLTEERLGEPFSEFDSIDERMKRIPNDLNDEKIRKEYIDFHIDKFLSRHKSIIPSFMNSIKTKYGKKSKSKKDLLFDIDA